MKAMPRTMQITPVMTMSQIIIVKYRPARFRSPSPRVLAVRAEPPTPSIAPSPPRICMAGMIRLTAAKAVLLT